MQEEGLERKNGFKHIQIFKVAADVADTKGFFHKFELNSCDFAFLLLFTFIFLHLSLYYLLLSKYIALLFPFLLNVRRENSKVSEQIYFILLKMSLPAAVAQYYVKRILLHVHAFPVKALILSTIE
jgi:hypothetical protein